MDNMILGILLGLSMGIMNIVKPYVPEKVVTLIAFGLFVGMSLGYGALYGMDALDVFNVALKYGGPTLGFFYASKELAHRIKK